jgi:quercetin dioxygenase-like cupin family protein
VHVVRIEDLRPPGGGSARFEGYAYGASVSFFVIDAREGDGPGLHTHPYEETFVILEGGATFTVDGQAREATAGTVVVVPAGAVHRFTVSRDGMRSVNIHGAARMVQENLAEQA